MVNLLMKKHLRIPMNSQVFALVRKNKVDLTGLEPVASTMSTWRSSQLSYRSLYIKTLFTLNHRERGLFNGRTTDFLNS